jgi:hypothetical protein
MKRIIIVGIALLAGGSMLAQNGDRKPQTRTFTCVMDMMVPDQVTAKPWPAIYPGTPAKETPVVKPNLNAALYMLPPSKPQMRVERAVMENKKPY